MRQKQKGLREFSERFVGSSDPAGRLCLRLTYVIVSQLYLLAPLTEVLKPYVFQ